MLGKTHTEEEYGCEIEWKEEGWSNQGNHHCHDPPNPLSMYPPHQTMQTQPGDRESNIFVQKPGDICCQHL